MYRCTWKNGMGMGAWGEGSTRWASYFAAKRLFESGIGEVAPASVEYHRKEKDGSWVVDGEWLSKEVPPKDPEA